MASARNAIASLPSIVPAQIEAQRGAGVFDKSIEALRRLNALGYGQPGSGLTLTLVTNPVGAFVRVRGAEVTEEGILAA